MQLRGSVKEALPSQRQGSNPDRNGIRHWAEEATGAEKGGRSHF